MKTITTYEERVRDLMFEEDLTMIEARADVLEAGNCPKCGSYDIVKRSHRAPPGCDTDWTECQTCDHQWGHE